MSQKIRVSFQRNTIAIFAFLIAFIIALDSYLVLAKYHNLIQRGEEYLVFILLIPFVILLLAFLTLFNSYFTISNDKIEIHSYIYHEKINRDDIEKIVFTNNLDPGYLVSFRITGYNFPGTQFGWFRLTNGKKAFLLISGKVNNILIFELKDGKVFMISGNFLEKLINYLNIYKWDVIKNMSY
ncbi:PH domain-containing protein [Caldisphaera lagunensis]|uniref:PH domain-containing protein n=1 Tax=Caldisphaera lagunensis TaxID=200415 RepID=UPI00155B1864|nr:PH domain-containing protein [Caldisphaera lagunensis]